MTALPSDTEPNTSKSVVMFCRKYNDIDHMAPIAYALAKAGHSVQFLSLSPLLDLENDYRATYVRDNFGVKLGHVYRDHSSTAITSLVAWLMSPKYAQIPARGVFTAVKNFLRKRSSVDHSDQPALNPIKLPLWFTARFFQRFLFIRLKKRWIDKQVFNREWGIQLFEDVEPDVAVFDWVKPHQWSTAQLTASARYLGIPTISVPHGVHLLTDSLYTNNLIKRGYPIQYDGHFNDFDAFVVQFEGFANTVIAGGLSKEKVLTLGSTRYCKEWHSIYDRITPDLSDADGLPKGQNLKIVFMDYSDGYRINTANVQEGLEAIAKIPGIDLVVKPATRSDRLGSAQFPTSAKIVTNIPSLALCEWADVVIGTTSSILIEPLLRNKVLLYPKHFHGNSMVFEEMNACWNVGSTAELVDAIHKLKADPTAREYESADVEAFLEYVVDGGEHGRDVLGSYVDLITKQIFEMPA
jgi:hypothetical protein